MIRYITTTGKSKSNHEARAEREYMKVKLAGVNCDNGHRQKATLRWYHDKEYGAILTIEDCCCEDFADKLNIIKQTK